jgi:organic hydroperoxide reductase OsmC/OhrA
MLTMMGIVARQHDIPFSAARARVTKHMAASPRRIQKLEVVVEIPDEEYPEKTRKILEQAAIHCPVAKSLHEGIVQEVTFNYSAKQAPR